MKSGQCYEWCEWERWGRSANDKEGGPSRANPRSKSHACWTESGMWRFLEWIAWIFLLSCSALFVSFRPGSPCFTFVRASHHASLPRVRSFLFSFGSCHHSHSFVLLLLFQILKRKEIHHVKPISQRFGRSPTWLCLEASYRWCWRYVCFNWTFLEWEGQIWVSAPYKHGRNVLFLRRGSLVNDVEV